MSEKGSNHENTVFLKKTATTTIIVPEVMHHTSSLTSQRLFLSSTNEMNRMTFSVYCVQT
jgi:hypothetical protein